MPRAFSKLKKIILFSSFKTFTHHRTVKNLIPFSLSPLFIDSINDFSSILSSPITRIRNIHKVKFSNIFHFIHSPNLFHVAFKLVINFSLSRKQHEVENFVVLKTFRYVRLKIFRLNNVLSMNLWQRNL